MCDTRTCAAAASVRMVKIYLSSQGLFLSLIQNYINHLHQSYLRSLDKIKHIFLKFFTDMHPFGLNTVSLSYEGCDRSLVSFL